MSLKYGLNIKKKTTAQPVRRAVFDDEEGDGEDNFEKQDSTGIPVEEISTFSTTSSHPRSTSNSTKVGKPKTALKISDQDSKQDLSALHASKAQHKAAEEIDPSIFDYDSFHDAKTSVTESKKVAARQEAIERKPKYINNLLDAAARRKQDQQVAREKLLQREREAEGDEFADKEKFVTGAYKQQQEETKRLQEEEERKVEEEEKRKRQLGGGMQNFYRSMMDQSEQQHQETVEATAKLEREGGLKSEDGTRPKSDAEIVAELKAKGVNVHLNEEGQITDKRELLSAGLNIGSSGRSADKHGADHLRTTNRPAQSAFANRNTVNRDAQRERQTRMMEEQLAAQTKRAREAEEEERVRLEKVAKSSKTDKDISDAKARYLARKAAKERGEG